jgi:hypothetical protein
LQSLAAQEAEICRFTVGSLPMQIVPQDPISKSTITNKELVERLKV